MYKKAWWLNPIGIYLILMALVLLAYRTTETQYSSLYGMQKGIEGKYVLLYFVSFLLFAVGYVASNKYRLKGNSFTAMDDNRINIDSVYRVYKILSMICLLAYAIWYANFLRINGISILSSFKSLSSISNMMYVMRNNSGRISGITTFSEIGMVSFPLGIYLLYKLEDTTKKKKIRIDIIILLALATFRALAFSERLAIIELLVPAAVMILSMTKSRKLRLIVFWGPVVGVALLIAIFAAFEYSRSWLRFYINYYDSFFEFIIQRIMGYYTNAINTECLYIKYGSTSILPYRSIQWLWELPGLGKIYEWITPYNVSEAFDNILRTYGNAEYNNQGGLLTMYVDFGLLFPIAQIIFGFFVGRIYRMYQKNNAFCVIFYSYIFLCLIELPRRFALGSSRSFIVFIGLFIYYYICTRSSMVVKGEEGRDYYEVLCDNSNI